MAVKFSLPLESANNFPPPHILATPKFRPSFVSLVSSFREQSDCIYTQNGRGALSIAGSLLKKEATKNVVLIPAYHCPALVEPFISLGYEIRFYPVREDLHVDLDVLQAFLSQGDVTHCILVRYFGFDLNVVEATNILKQNDVVVIEDCAHALLSFRDNLLNHNFASDAQICSINKLLPTIDGGILHLPNQRLPALYQRSWLSEFKGVLHTFGISQRLMKLKPKGDPTPAPSAQSTNTSAEKAFRYFVPEEERAASYRHTKLMAKFSYWQKVARKRRDNFQYLLKGLSDVRAGYPLYAELLDREVPYVLPFYLHSHEHFKALRMKGIQILRWEELADSDCAVSKKYHKNLIQLPCHHQLQHHQLDEIINTIKELE